MKSEVPEASTMPQALSSNVPAFLAKLWAMVNEEGTDSVIGWAEDNKSFYIRNQSVFSMELLPVYYKHNNMASFVRQLNMYGFRKVLSPMAGSLRNESDEMAFAHPDFVKDEPWGLENIKRKVSTGRPPALVALGQRAAESDDTEEDGPQGELLTPALMRNLRRERAFLRHFVREEVARETRPLVVQLAAQRQRIRRLERRLEAERNMVASLRVRLNRGNRLGATGEPEAAVGGGGLLIKGVKVERLAEVSKSDSALAGCGVSGGAEGGEAAAAAAGGQAGEGAVYRSLGERSNSANQPGPSRTSDQAPPPRVDPLLPVKQEPPDPDCIPAAGPPAAAEHWSEVPGAIASRYLSTSPPAYHQRQYNLRRRPPERRVRVVIGAPLTAAAGTAVAGTGAAAVRTGAATDAVPEAAFVDIGPDIITSED